MFGTSPFGAVAVAPVPVVSPGAGVMVTTGFLVYPVPRLVTSIAYDGAGAVDRGNGGGTRARIRLGRP